MLKSVTRNSTVIFEKGASRCTRRHVNFCTGTSCLRLANPYLPSSSPTSVPRHFHASDSKLE